MQSQCKFDAKRGLKMSPATVNEHETGKISPKMEQIKKYAELYDVPVEIIDI